MEVHSSSNSGGTCGCCCGLPAAISAAALVCATTSPTTRTPFQIMWMPGMDFSMQQQLKQESKHSSRFLCVNSVGPSACGVLNSVLIMWICSSFTDGSIIIIFLFALLASDLLELLLAFALCSQSSLENCCVCVTGSG